MGNERRREFMSLCLSLSLSFSLFFNPHLKPISICNILYPAKNGGSSNFLVNSKKGCVKPLPLQIRPLPSKLLSLSPFLILLSNSNPHPLSTNWATLNIYVLGTNHPLLKIIKKKNSSTHLWRVLVLNSIGIPQNGKTSNLFLSFYIILKICWSIITSSRFISPSNLSLIIAKNWKEYQKKDFRHQDIFTTWNL